LLTIVVSIVVAAFAYHLIADIISGRLHTSNVVASVIGFTIIALLVQLAISLLIVTPLSPFISVARHTPVSKQLDAMLGMLPGAIKGLAIAMAVVMILVLTPFGSGMDPSLGRSALAQHLLSGANQIASDAEGHVGLDLSDFMIVTEPSSDEGMRLPFTVTSGLKESSSDEEQMLQLVNDARAENGLAPLKSDPQLKQVAVDHSQEMLELGYFAHTSPLHGSPTDRLDAAGVPYSVAGENIAYAPTVDVAQRGLMRSPGHRANILSDQFTRVGIGVVVTPFGTRMFTQEFAGP
jgi:uncharacterized protein YkwD/uncharacterized membrane protein required for colicin V production